MERNLEFSIGEYYHIYSRGVDKQEIFSEGGDYFRFIKLLYLLNNSSPIDVGDKIKELSFRDLFFARRGKSLVSIGAYCLMPNHFHLLLKETTEGGISNFLRKILTSHSMFFNKKQERIGPLFQSRFKAKHIDNDDYFRYLFAYIHLNPIKLFKEDWRENGVGEMEPAKKFLDSYVFSSYLDYTKKERVQKNLLNTEDFPGYFEAQKDFEDYLNDWLSFGEKLDPSPRTDLGP